MTLKAAPIVLLVTVLQIVCATNYCDKSLCSSGQHIACNNDGTFASTCRNPAIVTFTQAHKNQIVDAHNVKRNLVASGKIVLEPACHMATMQWDDELAFLASLNVKQCKMQHDGCHNTYTFKYSGQNLAWITFYDKPDVSKLLQKSVDMWYNEIKNTKMDYINNYPINYNGPPIGHLTIMVADKNIRVGCAASTYAVTGKPQRAFLLVCNYATTNMRNFSIYQTCEAPASGCKTGRNPKYTYLCAETEVYNVNKFKKL